MKTIFVNTGLDEHLSKKIERGEVYNNVQEDLPRKETRMSTLYKTLERDKSFLNGFDIPVQQDEQLRKALNVISKVIDDEKNRRKEPVVSEKQLLEALDLIDEIATGQRR